MPQPRHPRAGGGEAGVRRPHGGLHWQGLVQLALPGEEGWRGEEEMRRLGGGNGKMAMVKYSQFFSTSNFWDFRDLVVNFRMLVILVEI